MNRLLPLVLLLPATVLADPQIYRSSDFHPNPNFKMVRRFADGKPKVGRVEQLGEVVILEGDDTIVSTSQSGYGVVFDGRAQNPLDITARFYSKFGDEFDEIIIFTTFEDQGAAGAAAYEISTQQDVAGIGQVLFDDAMSWGSQGKLHAFVNMMKWDQFDFPGVPITDPRNDFYPVLGQEFAHRWLSFMHYTDREGNVSSAMLGRDEAHWASTLEADGSFMDGNALTLTNDGSYQTSNLMTTYWELDLYGMGLIPASEVPPWFLIKNAVSSTGRNIDPANYLRNGSMIRGTREDITIDQVISAEGPRVPSWEESPHDFRVAFVLVTRPGERASEVVPIARVLDQVRVVWEQQFRHYTQGRASMCTQVSAPCGAIAVAHIDGGELAENGGNKNGVVEPGEPVRATFHINNDSDHVANNVVVEASENFISDAPSAKIDQLPAQTRRDVVLEGSLPADAPCGEPLTIDVASTVDGHIFRGFVEVIPGLTEAVRTSFAKSRAGWVANPDGKDSATQNGWSYGEPVRYNGNSGWIFQPDGCHESSKCWFTGLQRGHRAQQDSSLEPGESRLYSTPIDLSKTYRPVLSYWAWFQAIDFSNPMQGGIDATGVTMVLEGSTDDGKTWSTLDTLAGSQPAWQPRKVVLDGLVDLGGTLLLRFTAANPVATTAVEAGVDDLRLTTLTSACNPLSGKGMLPPPQASGGCDVTGTGGVGMWGLLLVAGVALLRRRRRLA